MIIKPFLALGLFASAVGAIQDAAVVEAPTKATNLERALATITTEEIRADLEFIASDEMAGRDSPSPQLKIAARFIRARLKRFGFMPGAQDESYLHEWQINQTRLNRRGCSLSFTIGGKTFSGFELGEDYFLADWNSLGKRSIAGGVVYGGKMRVDDIEALDAKGKWVLADVGVRGKRVRLLRDKGALGLIVLPAAKDEDKANARLRQRDRRFNRGGLSFDERKERENTFATVHLTSATMGRLPAGSVDGLSVGDEVNWTVEETCDYGAEKITLENVVGIWPGSDPKLKDEVIILSAHYDHVGVLSDGRINNGADDNGSGTTGMLAIAEALHAYGPMRRSVMLMWVSAEEKGLLGSEAWAKDPYLPGGLKPLCNINIDMIGRNASDEFLITPTRKHEAYSALTQVAEANAELEGFTKIKSADAYWSRSDHANFERHMNLPVAFLFCDVHEDYHKPTDTPDKINYDKMRRICRLVIRMLEALQIDKPKF